MAYLDIMTNYIKVKELVKIAKQLHKSYENSCNYNLTPRQEIRENKLELRVHEIANSLGLHAYLQTDPRGGTLYLDDKPIPANNYSSAHFIV